MDMPKNGEASPSDSDSASPPPLSRRRRFQAAARRWLWRSLPALTIAAIALYLIWPVPKGQMPLSADHNVHLARAAMVYDKVVQGHLSGWSSNWFIGFPVGELYPPAGDYAIVLVKLLSFGKLSFQKCYALVFAFAYVFQAVVMIRIARSIGVHPVAGMVAGFLLLYDGGVLREGGWRYTVYYGVWLQPIACALLWWAMAELYRSINLPAEGGQWLRKTILPAVLFGLAMLTHPIVLPTSAVMMTLFVLFVGLRSKTGLGPVALRSGVVLGLGVCLILWWLGPLFAHRHWMATFGTLYSSLGAMLGHVLEGHFAKRMASGVGYGILVGLFWAWIKGSRFTRFMATASVVLWMMSTSDFFWLLRLDWLHEGFLHMQYQRFIICAKPGLFLCAGVAVVGLVRTAWGIWEADDRGRRAGIKMFGRFAAGTGLLVWMLSGAYNEADKHKVGEVQLTKLKDKKRADAFEKELAQLCKWSKAQWDEREEFFRIAFRARRHSHVYMDITSCNGAPAYKVGYMPGDVFVHRPETSSAELLDHLRVKYTVESRKKKGRKKPAIAFGRLKVTERELTEQVARIDGVGEVGVLVDDPDVEGLVEIEVTDTTEDSVLVFNIAGYPRWELTHDGEPVDWFEVPAVGDGEWATQADRKAGLWRRGTPGAHKGREPTLLAANAADGVWRLRYRHWLPIDRIALVALCFALLVFIGALVPALRPRLGAIQKRVEAVLVNRHVVMVVVAVVVAVPALRYVSGLWRESSRAVGWLRTGKVTDVRGVSIEPLKSERLISPAAVIKEPKELDGFASVTFTEVPMRDTITGWYAIEDGHADKKHKGNYTVTVLGRATGSNEDWSQLNRFTVKKSIGQKDLELDLTALEGAEHVDIAFEIDIKGSNPPKMGFDLDLEVDDDD